MSAVPSLRGAAQRVGLRLALAAPQTGKTATATPALALQRAQASSLLQQVPKARFSTAVARQDASASSVRGAVKLAPPRAWTGSARGLSTATLSSSGAGAQQGAASGGFSVAAAASGSVIAALALAAWRQQSRPVECEDLASRSYASAKSSLEEAAGEKPESMVDVYQLGFGTICGICAGIFIKKGLKLIAFALGGTYVLMQYFSSQRWITIDWKAIGSKYEKFVDTASGGPADPAGNPLTNSRLARIWQRLVHFLTADFQQRATFTAGLVLGFRLG